MKKKISKTANGHIWHFIQTGGLVQLQFTSVDDVLNLEHLDPKLWTALACPVTGLEFSEETLALLDSDKNGRVRVPEILEAVRYIKKYFRKPQIIMTEGDTIPLDAFSDELFDCKHTPLSSAQSVLRILGKENAAEISLDDISVNEKLFSPSVINGDGVLPPDVVSGGTAAAVIRDIVSCTGGAGDISGVKGITREQFTAFFDDMRSVRQWHDSAEQNAPNIFFLKDGTDAAAAAFMKVRDKISDFFLRCSLVSYDNGIADILHRQEESFFTDGSGLSVPEQLARLPIAVCAAGKPLPLDGSLNPVWLDDMKAFVSSVVTPVFGAGKDSLTEDEWLTIESGFRPYIDWFSAKPVNSVSSLSFARIGEILSSDAEQVISKYLDEEENHPPIALATVDLRKMLLYRRDFLRLLKNFVSFEYFYTPEEWAVFQCGVLYIDGRSCDLCFKVTDAAKHALMSPLSQCFLLYCDCVRPGTGEKMQIAALISNGARDNLIVGRNGLFFDRKGQDWDATVIKLVENPVSVREAFWSPYKKLMRMIQEKAAKSAADADSGVIAKLSQTVDKPGTAGTEAVSGVKKIDVGTIAAISVAFTGIATVVGGLLQAFFGLGFWIPLGIAGIMLAISLPSMLIAWSKLRQRNISPVLDASGWAVNGNVRINPVLGTSLTKLAVRPPCSQLAAVDPLSRRKFPVKTLIICLAAAAVIASAVTIIVRHPEGLSGVIAGVKSFFAKFSLKK